MLFDDQVELVDRTRTVTHPEVLEDLGQLLAADDGSPIRCVLTRIG